MIIYIHGFGSHGYGSKARAVRAYFKKKNIPFIAPSLSYVPELAIQTLEELIESYDDVQLIGSSLGGYYAMYLADKYRLKSVLINPAIYPYKTLKHAIPKAPNFYDGSFYTWHEKHLEMLEKYSIVRSDQNNLMLMLQKGDDVLDYKEALETLHNASLILEEDGSHSFDGIERYFKEIEEFLLASRYKHTSMVKGVSFDNKILAERIGDIYYDDMALFLEEFSQKLTLDAKADAKRGRKRLSIHLTDASSNIKKASEEIDKAWEVCAVPTLKWLHTHGANREMLLQRRQILPTATDRHAPIETLRPFYRDKAFLPYSLDYKPNKEDSIAKVFIVKYALDVQEGLNWYRIIYEYFEALGWSLYPNLIEDKSASDWRWINLFRLICIKDDKFFYMDLELDAGTERSIITFHYGDDCKEMIEERFNDE